VGSACPTEEMTPFNPPISEGGPGCGAAPREKAASSHLARRLQVGSVALAAGPEGWWCYVRQLGRSVVP
jgi:hypothetical protein